MPADFGDSGGGAGDSGYHDGVIDDAEITNYMVAYINGLGFPTRRVRRIPISTR